MTPDVTAFFHDATSTISYLVSEPGGVAGGAHTAIVDSVLDYDARSGRSGTEAADKIVAAARERGLQVDWILETHAHADHLTAAPYLQEKLGGRIAIGAGVTEVQTIFKGVFNLGDDFATDGSQFDRLFGDGESFDIGAMRVEVLHTPGHTPACATYVFGDAVFVGDTIFMPDFGTARCDFPGGDAVTLYRSIQRILALPPETRLFMCHDYAPDGRAPAWQTTVAEERAQNLHARDGVSEADFVALRDARDAAIDLPALILPSVQVNIRAGHFPPPDDNGVSYLRIPLNLL
ncbi:MAG: MBL fold metallo-hydrolase [Proteobacteria bacterium]|nr:MBL fold metallo-hydrolase [Pseudomonadota bacterium]